MACQNCGAKHSYLHRECRYCGKLVCSDCLLPEKHGCVGIKRGWKIEERGGIIEGDDKFPTSLKVIGIVALIIVIALWLGKFL